MTEKEMLEFNDILKDYLNNDYVKKMNDFCAHGDISVLKHSINVAKKAYQLNKVFNCNSNLNTLLVGALLHDFYLYDWHNSKLHFNIFKMHGYTHPFTARDNAIKHFNINKDIQDVIRCHMWPLTLRNIPNSKEALLVCLADKWCALKETFHHD